MTQQPQQPFMARGAVDLSGLKRPAPQPGQPAPGGPGGPGGPGAPGAPSGGAAGGGAQAAYAVQVSEESFQATVEASMTAPVILCFYSPSQSPESADMADDVAQAVGEYDGRYLAGLVDVDASPGIAQAMQIQQIPLLLVVLDGRPVTQPIPGLLGLDDVRTLLQQLGQQLTAQGVSGRHEPRHPVAAGDEGEDAEPPVDPRYLPAQEALARDDVDTAVAEYQKLVDANPADGEAAAGLAMATVLQRTRGVDLNAARAAAAAAPDDVDAQTMVADLDMLGGHVEDAFARLVELVRRTAGAERTKAREHLLGLFAAVGNDDPRVAKGRQALASALF
ncbi:MAG: co-chaperone YbbN [Nocardioides sp.]|nr:co-chaperone YbbN [Nocardioides sp.]